MQKLEERWWLCVSEIDKRKSTINTEKNTLRENNWTENAVIILKLKSDNKND